MANSLEESRRRKRKQKDTILNSQREEMLKELGINDNSNSNHLENDNLVHDKGNSSSVNVNTSLFNKSENIKSGKVNPRDINIDDYLNMRNDGTYKIDPTNREKVATMSRYNVQLYAILKKKLASRKFSDYLNLALAQKMYEDGLLHKEDVQVILDLISGMF